MLVLSTKVSNRRAGERSGFNLGHIDVNVKLLCSRAVQQVIGKWGQSNVR